MTSRIVPVFCLLAALAATAPAQNWLYLTPDGAWISRTTPAAEQQEMVLEIPGDAREIWIENEAMLRHWSRTRGTRPEGLAPGTPVNVPVSVAGRAGIPAGEYEVVQVIPFGVTARPTARPDALTVLSPTVLTESDITGSTSAQDRLELVGDLSMPRQVAWFTDAISGDATYRLDMGDNGHLPQLTQSLIIDNRGGAISVDGLMFEHVTGGRTMPPVRAMSEMTMSATVSETQEAVSDQAAVITSPRPRSLTPDSLTVLPVSNQRVDVAFSYHHRLFLDSGGGMQPSRQTLEVSATGGDELPRLAGPVSVNWFDQKRARQAGYYPAGQPERVRVDLGTSPLVSASIRPQSENNSSAPDYQLRVTNRTEEAVAWSAEIVWQDADSRHQHRLSDTLAPGESVWSIRRQQGELIVTLETGG